jgi:hypothetical protein
MKRRLKDSPGVEAKTQPDETDSVVSESSARISTARVLSWEARSAVKTTQEEVPTESRPAEPTIIEASPAESRSVESRPVEASPAETSPAGQPEIQPPLPSELRNNAPAAEATEGQPAQTGQPAVSNGTEKTVELFKSFTPGPTKAKSAKGWFKRLFEFEEDSAENRRSSRESIEGLAAYFFTGGTPVPQEIRDISATGAYIYTRERWYPGTIVRLTLTDVHDPGSERCITLNSSVVRNGTDGVALRFVFGNPVLQSDGAVIGTDKQHVERFLGRLRGATSDAGPGNREV